MRRNAIKLLARLLSTHPFSILHGGLLSRHDWNSRLEACEEELLSLQPKAGKAAPGEERAEGEQTVDESLLDDATQMDNAARAQLTDAEREAAMLKAQHEAETAQAIDKLQLTRRYYIEALRFIDALHAAAALVTHLLSSKNKSEVIEAMDFFVAADAYHIEPAKAGIRRMLRLIWTKGNSDEGKGVQTHLIEAYKGLFFAAPDHFAPNEAANYIATGAATAFNPVRYVAVGTRLSFSLAACI